MLNNSNIGASVLNNNIIVLLSYEVAPAAHNRIRPIIIIK